MMTVPFVPRASVVFWPARFITAVWKLTVRPTAKGPPAVGVVLPPLPVVVVVVPGLTGAVNPVLEPVLAELDVTDAPRANAPPNRPNAATTPIPASNDLDTVTVLVRVVATKIPPRIRKTNDEHKTPPDGGVLRLFSVYATSGTDSSSWDDLVPPPSFSAQCCPRNAGFSEQSGDACATRGAILWDDRR